MEAIHQLDMPKILTMRKPEPLLLQMYEAWSLSLAKDID